MGAHCQYVFSTQGRWYLVFNMETGEFEEKGYEPDYSSLFEISEQETLFKHTISNMKSTYYIENREYDAVNNKIVYDVISDVGNKYIAMFFLDENNQTILMGSIDTEIPYFYRFKVKSIFKR